MCIRDSASSDTPRATFTPDELADITIAFYKRNYIEGLFLSSAVVCSPDHTTQMMIRALRKLREVYGFNGYIHAKAIPNTSPELIQELGMLVDRLSVNIELPSQSSVSYTHLPGILAFAACDACSGGIGLFVCARWKSSLFLLESTAAERDHYPKWHR